MSESNVTIKRETGGFDITAIVAGEKKRTTWRQDFRTAYNYAREWADYYTDDNGQSLKIVIPEDIILP